jgi:hypothetical protein
MHQTKYYIMNTCTDTLHHGPLIYYWWNHNIFINKHGGLQTYIVFDCMYCVSSWLNYDARNGHCCHNIFNNQQHKKLSTLLICTVILQLSVHYDDTDQGVNVVHGTSWTYDTYLNKSDTVQIYSLTCTLKCWVIHWLNQKKASHCVVIITNNY